MLALVAGALHAQDYPSRTIRIVVPSARGGAGDSIARLLAERLGSVLRSPVIVENRPGASGLVGNEYVMRARPRQLHYASSGVGSANHVDTEGFAAPAGVSLIHVPCRGTADGYRVLRADFVKWGETVRRLGLRSE